MDNHGKAARRYPQVVEIQLVQEGRVGGDQLFALEAIDGKKLLRRSVQRRRLAAQGVQALDGTRVDCFRGDW